MPLFFGSFSSFLSVWHFSFGHYCFIKSCFWLPLMLLSFLVTFPEFGHFWGNVIVFLFFFNVSVPISRSISGLALPSQQAFLQPRMTTDNYGQRRMTTDNYGELQIRIWPPMGTHLQLRMSTNPSSSSSSSYRNKSSKEMRDRCATILHMGSAWGGRCQRLFRKIVEITEISEIIQKKLMSSGPDKFLLEGSQK